MPNRFQRQQHKLAYDFIAARDGEYCLVCRRRPPAVNRLEIDHADNNTSNWDPDNLHLLCQRCNLKLRQLSTRDHKKLIRHYSAINVSERERDLGNVSTHQVKELVDYRSGSTEMQANSYYETKYREWLLSGIKNNGFITKEDAVNSGAEVTGCNPITTSRYLAKMTSSAGVLKKIKDGTGSIIITFKKIKPPDTGTSRESGSHTVNRGAGHAVPIPRPSKQRSKDIEGG